LLGLSKEYEEVKQAMGEWKAWQDQTKQKIGEMSSHLQDLDKGFQDLIGGERSVSSGQIYKCRGKDCTYETGDIGSLIEHHDTHLVEKLTEAVRKAPVVEHEKAEPQPTTKHKNAVDYVECPDCRRALEEAFRTKGFKVVPIEEKTPEPKKRGLLR